MCSTTPGRSRTGQILVAEPIDAPYDRFAEAYRDWWGPVLAASVIRFVDDLDGLDGLDARGGHGGPMRIVDVGTGTGTLALAALERWPAATVIGVDQSSRILELASERAEAAGGEIAERLQVVTGQADRLPVRDRSVDLVLSSFVIQLVPNRRAALREMRRVLRPEGVCGVLTWLADDEPFEPEELVYDIFEDLEVPVPEHGPQPRPYRSPDGAAAEFRRAGFREVHARQEWLEHQFSVRGYVDLFEHWLEEESIAALSPTRRERLRAALLERLGDLQPDELVWRRPLVSVVARS